MIGLSDWDAHVGENGIENPYFMREIAKNEKPENVVLSQRHDRAPCRNGPCGWLAFGLHDRASSRHDRANPTGARKLGF